jgi:hypothetical protein
LGDEIKILPECPPKNGDAPTPRSINEQADISRFPRVVHGNVKLKFGARPMPGDSIKWLRSWYDRRAARPKNAVKKLKFKAKRLRTCVLGVKPSCKQ